MKKIKFEVIHVAKENRKNAYLIARILDSSTVFSLSDRSTLAGIAIKPCITQPRALDNEGKPRFDLFVFYLIQFSDLTEFTEGQEVELITD